MSDEFASLDGVFTSLGQFVSQFSGTAGSLLFRGESSVYYPTTTSMLERVRQDHFLPPRVRQHLEGISEPLATNLAIFLGIKQDEAWGFLQHYEFPTDRLDFTSDASIAAYFALGSVKPVAAGTEVLLATLPRNTQTAGIELVDLRNHPKASRPRWQQAFTLYVRGQPGINLKSHDARKALGLKWYKATVTQSDLKLLGNRHDILDAHADLVAGVISLVIDDFAKMNDWSAKWLADHVVAAPFITGLAGRDQQGNILVELISTSNAGFEYDELVERVNNHRFWSNQCIETRGNGGFANLRLKK